MHVLRAHKDQRRSFRTGYGPQSAASTRPAPYPPQAPPQYGSPPAPGQYGAPPQQPQQQRPPQQQYGAVAPAGFGNPQQPGDPAARLAVLLRTVFRDYHPH
jgi:hypothetical protein